MWTLRKCKKENTLNVVVKDYDGQVLIHFRHFSKVSGEDRWYPTKMEVVLKLGEWDKFVESLVYIDAKVKQLRCKNEQVEPIPPTSIKRNLESAFGEDDWVCGVFVLWMLRIVKSCIIYVVSMLLFICMCRFFRHNDHGAIWEWGRFGGVRMVWCLGSGVQAFHLYKSGSLMWLAS